MKLVQPIRDREKLEDLKEELKKKGLRDYMLFLTGSNSGMRVSDVVNLNVNDVRNKDGTMKSHIIVIEKKTKKVKKFPLCNDLFKEMERYTKNMKEGEYLFKSRNGENKAITTTQAYRIIKRASSKLGLEEIGTHTMRKSFGYHHYQQYKDVALLQTIYNHSSPSITLKYIGINQDNIDLGYRNFSI